MVDKDVFEEFVRKLDLAERRKKVEGMQRNILL
jgi:hypothetical protein